MMRAAFVTGCLKLGGSTTFLCNICGEFVRRGIPTQIISFEKDHPLKADFDELRIPVITMDENRMIFEDRVSRAFEQLREFTPSVVFANLGPISFEMLRYVPKGTFRVGIGHSDHPLVYETLKTYAPVTDALGVVSTSIKKNLEAFPETKSTSIYYLPLGVHISERLERCPNRDQPIRILYLGRLDREQKRAHLFPQIFEQLKAAGVPFHWTIAGEGPEKQHLERSMRNSPNQTASFPGTIPYKQVSTIMNTQDVLILASDYEGLPLTLLEAMGAGVVPVVSNLPSGIPEVVDNRNGILVDVNDLAGYARGIVHLHHNRGDLIQKAVSARERVVKEFSIGAMADRWLSIVPEATCAPAEWRSRIDVKPPLTAPHSFRFSPGLRLIRRIAAKLRR